MSTSSSANATATTRPVTDAERTSDARQAFLTAIAETAGPLNAKVQTQYDVIHEQATHLNEQQLLLERKTQELKKENDEMERWIEKANKKLTELNAGLGDDYGLGEGFEDDLGELEDMLDLIEEEEGGEESEDGTGAEPESSKGAATEASTHA